MSKSFFDLAIGLTTTKDNNEKNYSSLELKKNIAIWLLKDKKKLNKLKIALCYRKPDGSPWGNNDAIVLEEYLAAISVVKLKQLYQALIISDIKISSAYVETLCNVKFIINSITPLVAIYEYLSNNPYKKIVESISNWWQNKQIARNNELDLTTAEQNKSEQYSKIFVYAANVDKKYNKLYREILKFKKSPEQILSSLLYYIKNLEFNEFQLEIRKILLKTEEILLNGLKLSNPKELDLIVTQLQKKLVNSYFLAKQYHNTSLNSVKNIGLSLEPGLNLAKINTTVAIFKDIAINLTINQQQVAEAPLTQRERNKINQKNFNHKRKLLHFILQVQAFSKEETLHPNISFNEPYLDNNKLYDTYFDFWLSKVPEKAYKNFLQQQSSAHFLTEPQLFVNLSYEPHSISCDKQNVITEEIISNKDQEKHEFYRSKLQITS